jgi:endonuclease/exonuclease/phosphatase family metal-dependent hydrolase
MRLRIVTLNVNAGFDFTRRRFVLPALREALRGVDADVVLLQEVLGRHAGHARRHADWPEQPQHAFLADTRWLHHAYGLNAVFDEGEQGNAVLSRFPIHDVRNHDVSVIGHEPRGLLHVQMQVSGSVVHVICVHLGLLESHRRHQMQLLGELIEETIPVDAPLIVAGDFNDWRGRGHARMERAGLVEAFQAQTGRLARTFPARRPVLAVDRIYYRNADVRSTATLSSRPWSHLSDHAALFAELALSDLHAQ